MSSLLRWRTGLVASLCLIAISAPAASAEWQPSFSLPAGTAPDFPGEPKIMVDSQGATFVAWRRWDAQSGETIDATSRPAGGSFGPVHSAPLPSANRGDCLCASAFNAAGEAVFASPADGIELSVSPAGGQFGPPRVFPDATNDFPDVAIGAAGDALAVWNVEGPNRQFGFEYASRAAYRPANGSFGPAEKLVPPYSVIELGTFLATAINPRGDVLVVTNEPRGNRRRGGALIYPIWARVRPKGGSLGRRQAVALRREPIAGDNQAGVRTAMNTRGDAVVLWFAGREKGAIRAAFRPAGKRFRAPVTLARYGGLTGSRRAPWRIAPAVAIDEQGRIVAAWRRFVRGRYRIEAVVRPPGRRFGKPQLLTDAQGAPLRGSGPISPLAGPGVAIGGRGDAVVFWDRTEQPFGRNDGSFDIEGLRVEAAVRTAEGSFGAAEIVSRRAAEAYGVVSPVGRVDLTWVGFGPTLSDGVVEGATYLP